MTYAFTENFMLPLSHDEVVYGKRSLIGRMPGDEWQQFANLRLLYSYMFTHPGTNLVFMGAEFGQREEWNFQHQLDWYVLEYDFHKGVQNLMKDLNRLYTTNAPLYDLQFEMEGFEWINYSDAENSVLSYIRKDTKGDMLIICCNFTPIPRDNYRIGLPQKGKLKEILNSDDTKYGGSGVLNSATIKVENKSWNYREYSAVLQLPPLGAVVLKYTK